MQNMQKKTHPCAGGLDTPIYLDPTSKISLYTWDENISGCQPYFELNLQVETNWTQTQSHTKLGALKPFVVFS